jgi:hypothetical protein
MFGDKWVCLNIGGYDWPSDPELGRCLCEEDRQGWIYISPANLGMSYMYIQYALKTSNQISLH